MNQSYASFDSKPPYWNKTSEPFYDKGQGIPKMNKNNITEQDVYRTPFLFTQEHQKDYKSRVQTAIRHTEPESELNKLFFSTKNMDRIQKQIKQEIHKQTKGKYRLDVDQEERDLLINMRAVYMEYGRFLPGETVRQVKKLNNKVVEQVVPSMLTEIKQYYGYLNEINGPLKPIARPMNVSSAGRRTLPSITTAWGL